VTTHHCGHAVTVLATVPAHRERVAAAAAERRRRGRTTTTHLAVCTVRGMLGLPGRERARGLLRAELHHAVAQCTSPRLLLAVGVVLERGGQGGEGGSALGDVAAVIRVLCSNGVRTWD
jgi:hypothetical protein